jgi:PAS domain S-box-containing protein
LTKDTTPCGDSLSSQGRYQRIIQYAKDGIAIQMDSRIVMYNPAFQALVGLDEKSILGTCLSEILRNWPHTIVDSDIGSMDVPSSFHTTLAVEGGASIPVEVTLAQTEYDSSPALLALVRALTRDDDTKSRDSEAVYNYQQLFDSSPIAYFSLSQSGIIKQVNEAACNLLGFPESTLLKRSISSVFPANGLSYDAGQLLISEVLQGKEIRDVEVQMVDSDGNRIWVSITASILEQSDSGRSIGLMATDINRRKLAEARANLERERAGLVLEVMTHDLNNVNQSLIFSLGLIKEAGQLSQASQVLLDNTVAEVMRASRMISNLRLISSMSDSQLDKEWTDVKSCIDRAAEMVRNEIESKTLIIHSEMQENQFIVEGHQNLCIVFYNMLLNSVMYTPCTNVEVDITAQYTPPKDKIRFAIEDTGPGVPDSLKEFIFKRSGKPEAQVVGRGLGLTLADRIVESLGGEVWVEDRVQGDHSKGARFVILLPAWNEQKVLECGKPSCIAFYKSNHCLFCAPTYEILVGAMQELGIPKSVISVVNVDDPRAGISEADFPMVPFIRICRAEIAGFADIEDVRVALMNLLMSPCYPY